MRHQRHPYSLVLLGVRSFNALGQGETLNSQEIQALLHATISLSQAVEIAEKQGLGTFTGGEFHIENGSTFWHVKVLNTNGLQDFRVHAMTGQIIEVNDEDLRAILASAIKGLNIKDLQAVKTTLAQAVAIAESRTNGKAVNVQVEYEGAKIQLDVFIRAKNGTEKLKIDGMSGKTL